MIKKYISIKSIIIFIFFIFPLNYLHSETLEEIATINLYSIDLPKFYKAETVQFFSSSKKSYGKYLCYKIIDLIEPQIKQLQEIERKQLIIIGIDSIGNSIFTTFYDYDNNTTKIPPYLLSKRVYGSVGDTVIAFEMKGKPGKLNLKPVEKELEQIVDIKVYLQFKNLSKEEEAIIFKPGTIIYPQDQKSVRWLGNVKYLKIYKINLK
ncbi:MAG: hypothetical protein N2319_09705 [Candidatus Kapabacteria bacterium]|nr:hypothetical protein [Candidatus Kapabacteria bacterium]